MELLGERRGKKGEGRGKKREGHALEGFVSSLWSYIFILDCGKEEKRK